VPGAEHSGLRQGINPGLLNLFHGMEARLDRVTTHPRELAPID
jgi:hypothetical protein